MSSLGSHKLPLMGGGDWNENVAQLKRENELLKEAGVIPAQTLQGGNTDEPNQD